MMMAGFALAMVVVALIIAAVCTCRCVYNRCKKKDDGTKIQNVQRYSNDISQHPTSVELPTTMINNYSPVANNSPGKSKYSALM